MRQKSYCSRVIDSVTDRPLVTPAVATRLGVSVRG